MLNFDTFISKRQNIETEEPNKPTKKYTNNLPNQTKNNQILYMKSEINEMK